MTGTRTYYLFKRMGLRFSVFIGLFLLFLSSCTSRKENQLLLHADSLMTEFPDSALIFLESIPFPQKLSRGGDYDFLLNSDKELDLTNKRFIVFELDNISGNKVLLPVVTLIIMETFIAKMRRLKGIRKMILIEECWKALMSANMSEYIKYLFKTVRKYFGEAVVVTQEVDDIISSPVVKEAIINNSDCKILLDQRKYMNKFDHIQRLLGLTDKERGQILSINQANHPGRFYREVWIGLGGTHSAVYATEVSDEEYAVYTTEESEKLELQKLAKELGGNLELAVKRIAEMRRERKRSNGKA